MWEKVKEHIEEIRKVNEEIKLTKNPKRKKQLKKHLHRLLKELQEYNFYLRNVSKRK